VAKKRRYVMESERRKYGDEMTNWEFLNDQLYQGALKGGYIREFNLVKERLNCLKPYQSPKDFMKAMWNDKALRENVVAQLKRLWLADYDFRQNSGLVLMLAMWRNAIASGEDYWSNLFINLAEGRDEICSKD
jgi:hypothetical protein